jgi:hypothetical protein
VQCRVCVYSYMPRRSGQYPRSRRGRKPIPPPRMLPFNTALACGIAVMPTKTEPLALVFHELEPVVGSLRLPPPSLEAPQSRSKSFKTCHGREEGRKHSIRAYSCR